MRRIIWLSAVFGVILAAVACSKTTVVLLPDPDGTVGAVNVANEKGSVDLNTPNQAVKVSGGQAPPKTPEVMPDKDINTLFSEVMAVQVPPPVHFLLYFEDNATILRRDSVEMLPAVIKAIEERQSVDISIVGHSDTAGDRVYNLDLSKRRAAAVYRLLVERGVDPTHIATTSHGEENPLVDTGDNVSEPKNRRVEVVVR